MSAPYARDVPRRMALVRAANRSAKASAIDSWTYNRSMEMQSWPHGGEAGADGTGGGLVEIGVLQDHHGVLAAEFE